MSFELEKLKFFAKYIEEQVGIVYAESNFFQLEHRLQDITFQLGLKSLDELWLKATYGIDGRFKALLLDLATNNETSFFRDAPLFTSFIKVMVPELIKANPKLTEIQIWSAASSSGQEAYSLAIALEEARLEDPRLPDYRITATDFSERILNRCRERTYSKLELDRGMPANLKKKYFDPALTPDTFVLNQRIPASKFEFKRLNLLEPWPFSHNFHIIFCRNVLIYQKVPNKIQVVDNITRFLERDGFLALGAAESLLGISDRFQQLHHETAVFYRKKPIP